MEMNRVGVMLDDTAGVLNLFFDVPLVRNRGWLLYAYKMLVIFVL